MTVISLVSLGIAVLCALVIVVDLAVGWAQRMWIMDLVWPITALWSGPIGLAAYFKWGRAGSKRAAEIAKEHGEDEPPNKKQPFPILVGKGATHCGSGCTLGDIIASGIFAVVLPFTIFGQKIFGEWVYAYGFALLFGILFQYFTIKPMRHLSVGKGLVEAVKADFFSLTAWQLGMYGWMAIARYAIFQHELSKGSPVFWFMMQIAMFLGFATAYPVNWLLVRKGVKEKM